ncbi:response regulator transcription factor [Paenibacillus sp. HWE-109]|uniref:response regulator transcription factor n=1 Tax=Paenibacillus sp. HWE-109 TaxID=1306526 RepID=UPI001EDF0408|nr:response regulator transcription factor [Paenibacillus sp. HWE-109]UKS31037.1 response regulator transcription factor [Paenibacillus sp. HWE-109]
MNILLAEDDPRLGRLIAHLLKKKIEYKVDWVMHGEDAYNYALASYYDVLILDWMMPVEDGVNVCRRLRKQGYSGAILLLTAKDSVQDRVEGLDAGADDYLMKPFEFDELHARLRALSRRNFAPLQEEVIQIDNITINRASRTVQRSGQGEIQLTPREFQLLDLLVQNRGQVLTRELILDRIWGYDAEVTSNPIDATIKLLRRKVDTPGEKTLIQNIRGVGYKFEK